MSEQELRAKIAHLETVHAKEIGMRVGETIAVLRELLGAKIEVRRLQSVIDEARRQLEASEMPFYRGMELLKGETR